MYINYKYTLFFFLLYTHSYVVEMNEWNVHDTSSTTTTTTAAAAKKISNKNDKLAEIFVFFLLCRVQKWLQKRNKTHTHTQICVTWCYFAIDRVIRWKIIKFTKSHVEFPIQVTPSRITKCKQIVFIFNLKWLIVTWIYNQQIIWMNSPLFDYFFSIQ